MYQTILPLSLTARPVTYYRLRGATNVSHDSTPVSYSFCSSSNNSTYCFIVATCYQCCFTSIETIRTIWDGEQRTATSTFTQFLSSDIREFEFSVALRP